MSKKLIMAAAAAAAGDIKALVVPLRSWIDTELEKSMLSNNNNNSSMSTSTKESIIRKVTVAYGIVELILRFNKNDGMRDQDVVHIDNFAVHVNVYQKSPLLHHRQRPWDDIKGVSMINPDIALNIEEPAYLSCFMEPDEKNSRLGRCLEVEQMEKSGDTAVTGADAQKGHDNERRSSDHDCYYLVAEVLHELLTHEVELVSSHALGAVLSNTTSTKEPASKKAKSSQMPSTSPRAKGDLSLHKTEIPFQTPSIVRMQHLGFPASLCLLIQSLLDSAMTDDNSQSSNDAYKSMKDVAEDLHLLLLDPERFLFDNEVQSNQNMELRYRKGKLYGRDKEETLITDAFCRVSRGKSEALFIGGFSGCGKSMLVNSLRARVNVVGGYVTTHKFDNVSQEKSLAGIISAANQLCLMLRDRNTPQKLALLTKKVTDEFGADVALLVRILKNLKVLSPEFVSAAVDEESAGAGGWDNTDARSVVFTLLRFLRLISTPGHPVMLFLDDLQWADESIFDAIRTFLSDSLGSCIFFVGTYRDNEVDADHLVFDLIKKLEMSHVPTSKVSLTGLKQEDLNTMISDALCLFPRICMPLTDIVSRKTGGSPYFVLEFMQSLQSRGLLQYNFHQSQWVWDEAMVGAEEITDNVLHLLSSKMSGLSDMEQLLLKVMACFGTYTNALVIGYLSESPEYSGVQDGLETVIGYGFVEKDVEGGFKFVHDKVREAAYNLIPESDKKRFHYNLGKALHSVCEEKDVGDTILLIASQINHGAEFTLKDDVLRIPIVKLNMAAGKRALDCCRHETAYRYLKAALALLPNDHWDSQYDLSLRLSSMMASAANSYCKYDEAEQILRRIVKEARCTKDKVPSYLLIGQIFHAQGKVASAYDICSSILKQLGETDPESIDPEAVKVMIPETLKKYDQIYGDDWLAKKMEDSTQRNIVCFYGLMATSAFFCKAPHILAYIMCKGVERSLEGGVSVHTPQALLHFCLILARNVQTVARAHLIAKNAMELSERLHLRDQIPELKMVSFTAVGDLEGYQLSAQRLRVCFDSALSSGNANIGFMCAAQLTLASIFSGEKELTSLLKEIDYYLHLLETYKSEVSKNYLLSYRETVSLLVDRGEVTGIEAKATIGDENDPGNKFLDAFYCQQVFRTFWLGYGERCRYFAQKGSARRIHQRKLLLIIKFYHGLVLLDMFKKKMNHTLLKEVQEIIESLKVASTQSVSSYRSKAELLEAELKGISAHRYYNFHNEAVKLYDAAIASAKSSKFIHEQGLACEKAGLYYKQMGFAQNAVVYLQQALICYKEWGSSVKVQDIQRKLNGLNVND